jgi:hypothetical protein
MDEEEEAKRNLEKQMLAMSQNLADAKKRIEEEAEQVNQLEELKKKLAKVRVGLLPLARCRFCFVNAVQYSLCSVAVCIAQFSEDICVCV